MLESKDFILTVIVAIVTLVLREGGPILKQLILKSTADRQVRAELETKGYEAVICRLDRQVKAADEKIIALETELNTAREHKHDCEKKFVLLELKLQQFEQRLGEKK